MDRRRCLVVIPAYNEAQTISVVVRTTSLYCPVLVVDDGSTDKTASLAIENGATVVHQPQNLGYESAIERGFAYGQQEGFYYLITFDADGQHSASDLEKILTQLEDGADLVVGVRPRCGRLAEHLFALYTRCFFGIRDPLSGLKAYSMEVYRAYGCFHSYPSTGTELLLFAARTKRSIAQMPIQIQKRTDHPRFGGVIRSNLIILGSLLRGLLPKTVTPKQDLQQS